MNTTLHSINFVCDPKRGQEMAAAEIEKTVNSLGLQIGGITWDRPVKGLAPVAASVSVRPALDWKPKRISHAMRRLHDMRMGMEADLASCGLPAQLSVEQATVLVDVCVALGLNRAEQIYVVGPAFRLQDDGGEATPADVNPFPVCAQMVAA